MEPRSGFRRLVPLAAALCLWAALPPAAPAEDANAEPPAAAEAEGEIPPLPKSGRGAQPGRAGGGLFGALRARTGQMFEVVRPEMRHFVPLVETGGRLTLDREHWQRVAEATDIPGLARMLAFDPDNEEAFKRQVLRLSERVGRTVFGRILAASGGWRSGFRSLDDEGTITGGGAGLDLSLVCRGEWVGLAVREENPPHRELTVYEGDGELTLLFVAPTRGRVALLSRARNGLVAGLWGPEGCWRVEARDYAHLLAEHPAAAGELAEAFDGAAVTLPRAAARTAKAGPAMRRVRPPAEVDPAGWPRGTLQQIQDATGQFLVLTVKPRGLGVDTGVWLAEAEAEGNSIPPGPLSGVLGVEFRIGPGVSPEDHRLARAGLRALARYYAACSAATGCSWSGHGWGCGGGSVRASWSTPVLQAEFDFAPRELALGVCDRAGPGCRIDLAETTHRFALTVRDGFGAPRLMIRQRFGRRIWVLDRIDSAEPHCLSAGAFGEFRRRYPAYVRNRLRVYLEHFGIRPPPDPDSPAVRGAVLAMLVGSAEREARIGRDLVRQLGARRWRQREEATKRLIEGFARYRGVVEEALAGKTDPETRRRLERVVASAASLERIERFIRGMGLLQDRAYLQGLLDSAAEADRPAVRKRLEALEDLRSGRRKSIELHHPALVGGLAGA